MTFRLHQAQYDKQTERAYVEFRRADGLAPILVAVDGIAGSSEPSKVKFWAQAWKAAYQKARTLGFPHLLVTFTILDMSLALGAWALLRPE